MEKEPKVLLRFFKSADKSRNKIIIPQIIVDNYGRDFYLEVLDDGTIRLVPVKVDKKEE
jgi:hypothetical protein